MDFTISLSTISKISQLANYQKHGEGQQQNLAKGQILQGLVSSKTNEGKFVLNLGDKQFIASTKIPLQPGQQLSVQVQETTPQITLKVISDILPQTIGKSIHLLDQQNTLLPQLQSLNQQIKGSPLISQSSKNILNLFTQILGQKPIKPLHQEQLRMVLQKTGINFEQSLASGDKKEAATTLKSVLIEIMNKFTGSEKIQKQASHLVKTIELYQTLNLKLSNDSLFFIPLPFPFLDHGYLLISPDDNDQTDPTKKDLSRKYSLHLKLEGLGDLQIDILKNNEKVSLKFTAQDPERAVFLKSLEEELQEWLTALQLESVSFHSGAENPVKHLLSKITVNQSGLLDTRA